jgi:N-acetylglucosaminyldiphosphoundecaprenol N-acetyl-beta-D-mannosaminyltransferase
MRAVRIGSLRLNVSAADEPLALVRSRLAGVHAATACVGFLNPHVYNLSAADPRVAVFIERCQAVCLDGIGVVLAGSLLNRSWLPRAAMHRVFDACVAAGLLRGRVVLLGLDAADQARAVASLARAAPEADFVAHHHGFRTDRDYAAILREHADADFVLAGMGTPRSEHVLLQAGEICRRALCWHVGGGTLRQWAGTKRRAPALVSRLGLEWLHRIAYEPQTRSRYAAGIPAFARRVLIDSLRRHPADGALGGGHEVAAQETERCES